MINYMHKTIGDQIKENIAEKRKKAQERIDELEEIILEMPSTDPKFEELVKEYNNLKIQVR